MRPSIKIIFAKFIAIAFVLMHVANDTSAQSIGETSLNGTWRFLTDANKIGLTNGYNKRLLASAKPVTVPHTWNIQKGLESYAGLAWYQKDVQVPAVWSGKAVFAKFAAVYHDAVIYVNGKKVGEHLNSGYTPFSFDISSYLNYGAANTVVVSCDNSFSATNLPFQTAFDWVNDGGIIRDVALYVCDRPSIRYVYVTPDLHLKDSSATAQVSIKLNEADVTSINVNAVLKERKSKKVIATINSNLTKTGDVFPLTFTLNKVTPWHFDNPFLYELQITINNNNGVSDTRTERIGFKMVTIDGEKITLNGEVVRLPGIEYMAGSDPAHGSAEPRKTMDSVARMMKQLNVTITRFHWQQDNYLLDLMDEYGILVQEEIPWWQKPAQLTPEVIATAKQQLTEMTEVHFNHASIYAWALNNEVPSTQQDNDALKAFTRALDPTRLINVVGNKMDLKLAKDPGLMGDLPAWNDYVGTWNGNDRTLLSKKLDEIHSVLGGRPLFISEAGLCEPAFAGGDARRIDDMHFHIDEWRSKPFIAGFVYFCLNDYRTQMGEEGKGKFQIRRHGLTDIYLKPKPSYYSFAQICSPVEISKVTQTNASDIAIEIKVKNSIPSYTINNYTVEYRDMNNKLQVLKVNKLAPGGSQQFSLPNINQQYAFAIKRPNGSVVASY